MRRAADRWGVQRGQCARCGSMCQGVGIGWDAIVLGLAAIPPISGRFETVDEGQNFAVIVDYAHTPDAIQAVIAQVRPLAGGRIIVVAGAGGDRDAAKRPMMGQAAATADAAVLTTDNPRSEDPEEILAAVAAGADRCTSGSVVTEVDRRAAIRYAVRLAEKQDVVLILGKGPRNASGARRRRHGFFRRPACRCGGDQGLGSFPMTVDLQWTLHDVARATSGSVRGDPATPITTVATDSRTAKPGSLFVAIRGERFDGHAFIGAATKGGSVAALIERGRGRGSACQRRSRGHDRGTAQPGGRQKVAT